MEAPSPNSWMIPFHYDAGYGRSTTSWAIAPSDLWSVKDGTVLHSVRR